MFNDAGTFREGTTLADIAASAADRESLTFLPNALFMHGAAHWLELSRSYRPAGKADEAWATQVVDSES